MLDPKRAMQQRVILLGRAQVEPYPPQASRRLQLRPRNMGLIVPEHSSVQCRPVRNQGCGEEENRQADVSLSQTYRRHLEMKNTMFRRLTSNGFHTLR